MSHLTLVQLVTENAFRAVRERSQLGLCHVPFDELTNTLAYEHRLRRQLENNNLAAVVARSGDGKSSMIEWVLNPSGDGFTGAPDARRFLPILIPVASSVATILADRQAFAQHVHATMAAQARRRFVPLGGTLTPGAARTEVSSRRSFAPNIGIPDVVVGLGELSSGITSVLEHAPAGYDSLIDQLREAIDLVRQEQLVPVMVVDDTDAWLAAGALPNHLELRHRFFDTMPRIVTQELGCASVIAVHPEYQKDAAYSIASDFIDAEITLPGLKTLDALWQLLERRAALAGVDAADLRACFDKDAISRLSGLRRSSIRRILRVCAQAASTAADIAADTISLEHVTHAIAEQRLG